MSILRNLWDFFGSRPRDMIYFNKLAIFLS